MELSWHLPSQKQKKRNLIKLFNLSRPPKNLIKLIYTFDKTPIVEAGCFSNLYYLLAVQAYSFLIHFI